MNHITTPAIRKRIQEFMDERGLCINAMSDLCGFSQSTLYYIMTADNNTVTVATIQMICDGLGIDLPTFFNSEVFNNL